MFNARISTGLFGSGRTGRAIARNFGWLMAGRGTQAVLSLLYLGFVTRALGVEDFGRFSLIVGAAQVLATLVAFQSWQVVVQYGVDLVRRDDRAALGRLYRGSLILDLCSAAAGATVAVIILELFSEQLGIGPTLKRATLIFAVIQVLTIRSTPLGILRLRDRFRLAAVADSITAAVRFVGAGVVMVVHPTVQGFMVVWALAEVVCAGAYWYVASRDGDLRLLWRARDVRSLLREHPGIIGFALSTNARSTLALSTKQAPLLVVGAVLGTTAAGAFRLASQLALALAKLAQLMSRAAFPEVVRAVRTAEPRRVRRMLFQAFAAGAAAGAAILLLVVALGRPALGLIAGHEFVGAYPILVVMAAAGCVELTIVAAETVMTARAQAGSVFLIRCLGLLAIAGVAAFAMEGHGAAGMAIAVLASSLTSAGLLLGLSWWRFRAAA